MSIIYNLIRVNSSPKIAHNLVSVTPPHRFHQGFSMWATFPCTSWRSYAMLPSDAVWIRCTINGYLHNCYLQRDHIFCIHVNYSKPGGCASLFGPLRSPNLYSIMRHSSYINKNIVSLFFNVTIYYVNFFDLYILRVTLVVIYNYLCQLVDLSCHPLYYLYR